jgi:uncharacterized membrane protein YjgN (DUF898 family)
MGEPPAAAAEAKTEPQSASGAIQFTGDGSAYFGIWIVNLVLSIVTLGFYSPWAKVRRLRYFYGHTLVDGSPFDFHGSPIAILRGRIAALLMVGAYTQTAKFSVSLWFVVVAVLVAIAPWMAWKSLRFRLGNTSYRGVRFGFFGSLGDSYSTFLPLMLLFVLPGLVGAMAAMLLSDRGPRAMFALFGLFFLIATVLYPWLYFRMKRYQHANARCGEARFSFSGTVKGSYAITLKMAGIVLAAIVVGILAGAAGGFILGALSRALGVAPLALPGTGPGAGPRADSMIAGVGGALIGYLVVLSTFPIASAFTQNYVWGGTGLASAPFRSEVGALALWRIQLVNAVMLVVTLGLYWPYALVRATRYRLSCMSWSGDAAAIAAQEPDAAVGASGEEAMELFGFDLSL